MKGNMKIVIARHGAPEVLETTTGFAPLPKSGEVRVKVIAAGVGYSDVMAQRGGYPLAPKPPFTPGYDFSGIVDKVGEDVQGLNHGDHVVALNPFFGCYSEYLCIPAEFLVPYPKHLDPAKVCSLVLNYLTAYCILHKKANIKPDQTILVHSAAGGVGSALIQLARLTGVKIYGTASLAKHEIVKDLGAIPIDYKSKDFTDVIKSDYPQGIDAAFDSIGGINLRRTYKVVKPGGTVVSYGFAGNDFGGLSNMILGVVQIALLNMIPDQKIVKMCALPAESKKNINWYREALSLLVKLLEEEQINPIVGEQIPLKEAYKAHELLESGTVSGKIVLRC
ncbi:medium chain dehydrogenase/reductase family protein [Salinispirillum marinum]|uniref:Medium chain dehydrogenase/reductase family protein n=2 Tax=Saccharospirillaceae TaxID=255527 RepID=A0ABV8B9U5_9GAMM